MGAVFPHPVRITNTLKIQGADNPWELHDFLYPHFAIPDPLTCITHYTLEGDVPAGISVNDSGDILGTIKWFREQPSCQDNWPITAMEMDGYQVAAASPNFEISGRFKHLSYLFKFQITAHWLEQGMIPDVMGEDELGEEIVLVPGHFEPCMIPGTTVECVEILEVKDHNICNYLWSKGYQDRYSFKLDVGASIAPVQKI